MRFAFPGLMKFKVSLSQSFEVKMISGVTPIASMDFPVLVFI